jgi:hypothetical protein
MATMHELFRVESWSQLYELDTQETLQRLDDLPDPPANEGDLLLAIMFLRAACSIDRGTRWLIRLTAVVVVLTIALFVLPLTT